MSTNPEDPGSTNQTKWVRVDHDAVLAEERNQKAEQVYKDLTEIKEIVDLTNVKIDEQQEKLDTIEVTVDQTDQNVEEAKNDVDIANEYHTCCGCCCCCRCCTIL